MCTRAGNNMFKGAHYSFSLMFLHMFLHMINTQYSEGHKKILDGQSSRNFCVCSSST